MLTFVSGYGNDPTAPAGSGNQKTKSMAREIKCKRVNGKWGFFYPDGRFYHFAHAMTKKSIVEHFAHYDKVFGAETKVVFV